MRRAAALVLVASCGSTVTTREAGTGTDTSASTCGPWQTEWLQGPILGAMGTLGDGDLFVLGGVSGPIPASAGPSTCAYRDLYLARIDRCRGSVQWSRCESGAPGSSLSLTTLITTNDAVYVLVRHLGPSTTSWAWGVEVPVGLVIVRVRPEDGAALWVRPVPDSRDWSVVAFAASASEVVVGGSIYGASPARVELALFHQDGTPSARHAVPLPLGVPRVLALEPSGRVWLAGNIEPDVSRATDMLFGSVSPEGVWSGVSFAVEGEMKAQALTLRDGGARLAAALEGTARWPGGVLRATPRATVMFDQRDGVVSGRVLPGAVGFSARATFAGATVVRASVLSPSGYNDVIVESLSEGDARLWSAPIEHQRAPIQLFGLTASPGGAAYATTQRVDPPGRAMTLLTHVGP